MLSAVPHSQVSYIETPLGRLKFCVDFVGGKIENLMLSQGPLENALPQGMSVSACFAVLLQFSVTENAAGFNFHCDWEDFDGQGYGCTGEALDAWEWEHQNHLVVVGTEDADWLNARIPLAPFTPDEYPITMEENRMVVRLEKLPEGRSYSLHFIVAWNPYPEPHECSCWYAVDVPHKVK